MEMREQSMSEPKTPLPEEDIRGYLRSLVKLTGLRFSFFRPGEFREQIVTGETQFCLELQSTMDGSKRCSNSIRSIVQKAERSGGPVFDLCHSRMGMAGTSIFHNGRSIGLVVACQALLHGLSEEHKDHLRMTGREIGMDNPDGLVTAAARNPLLSRTQLEDIIQFTREQLEEKAESRTVLEDTTEYLMDKYEELMFLYSITEKLAPEHEFTKTLSEILDKGLQKLSARSAFLLLEGENGIQDPEAMEVYGEPLWDEDPRTLPKEFADFLLTCAGPAIVLSPEDMGLAADNRYKALLVYPFRIKNYRTAFMVFAWEKVDELGDNEFKFVVALANQASVVLHTVHLYRELADLLFSTLEALSSAIDAKDPYTHGHSHRVADYAVKIAGALGREPRFLTMIKIAGQLHDFGKIGIAERILSKEGKLDSAERKLINEHPVLGAQILGRFKAFSGIVPGIRHHHERFDGGGYPDGLAGDKIPLVGRIIAVADAFDAMTSKRLYRHSLNFEEAKAELETNVGKQFDPGIVEAFLTGFGEGNGEDEL